MAKKKGCAPTALIALGVVTFVGLMMAVALCSVFPATLRLTSSVACPATTVKAVVVTTVSHPAPGQTNMSADLVCLDDHGRPERAGFVSTWGTAFVACWLLAFVLIAGPILVHRIRYRGYSEEA